MLSKAAEAADREYLRRQMRAKQKPVAETKRSSSPWRAVIIVLMLAVCGFGAWKWYTNDKQSDLDRLAAEATLPAGSPPQVLDSTFTSQRIWRLAMRFGVALAVFVVGYWRLKSSLSP
jgi:hypothetical protein